MNQSDLANIFMVFDNASLLIFALIVFCVLFLGVLYYHDRMIEAQEKLKDIEARNDSLQRSLFRITHYFDENDITSRKYEPEKTQALINARLVLTGFADTENLEVDNHG